MNHKYSAIWEENGMTLISLNGTKMITPEINKLLNTFGDI